MPSRTVSLDDSAEMLLRELMKHTGEQPGHLISSALEHYARQRLSGDHWRGWGVWAGFSITEAHTASRHGRPVLVAPNGQAFEAGDLLLRLDVYRDIGGEEK